MDRVMQYNYDEYGVYTGASECYLSPRSKAPIPAAMSTLDPPPVDISDGMLAVFDGGAWSILPDVRGGYYDETGERRIQNPREDVSRFTRIPRPSPAHRLESGKWVEDERLKVDIADFEARSALYVIDVQSIRPLRAVMAAMIEGRAPDAEDEKLLVEIEKRAVAERVKVKLEG